VVGEIEIDQFDVFEFGRVRGTEALEHPQIGLPVAHFVALCGVVDDGRRALEGLPECVLGMKVRSGQIQRPASSQFPRLFQNVSTVARADTGIDDERPRSPTTIPTLGTIGTR
jgi:hypothetical protein